MDPQDLRVEIVTSMDAVADAAHLFDDPVDGVTSRTVLEDERHHLLLAYVDDEPAGFVTGVELLHPDKSKPEMFLYELGVDERFRGRGVATALLLQLVELCRARGCGSMFALTDEDNAAARATYTNAGGEAHPAGTMFIWTFGG